MDREQQRLREAELRVQYSTGEQNVEDVGAFVDAVLGIQIECASEIEMQLSELQQLQAQSQAPPADESGSGGSGEKESRRTWQRKKEKMAKD